MGELSGRVGKSLYVKPYIEKWEKAGTMPEQRLDDSTLCGGGDRPKNPPNFAHVTDQYEHLSSKELMYNWQRCMLKNGYRYTGGCNPSRLSPACGAP